MKLVLKFIGVIVVQVVCYLILVKLGFSFLPAALGVCFILSIIFAILDHTQNLKESFHNQSLIKSFAIYLLLFVLMTLFAYYFR